jgi:dehydrogenase/reductase SDR family protein 12
MISQLVDGALEVTIAGSYSRIGYAGRSRLAHWAPPDRVEGRVVLVTGATSGIGRSIADELAGLGAVVIVVGRDESRGHSTVKAIVERTDNSEVSFERADLSRLADVCDLADRVARRHPRLDVLVHNAGALSRTYVRTEDGLELTGAVHVVAPFLLTHLLLDQLRAALDGRVITMSSGGMYSERLDVTALQHHAADYDGVKAYARAKRAQVELTGLWDLHYRGSGLRFVSMHPGWVATRGLDSGLPRFARLVRPVLRTPEQGADTAVWLATAPPAVLSEGRFWLDRRPRREHLVPWTRSAPAEPQRLWEWCTERAGVYPAREG